MIAVHVTLLACALAAAFLVLRYDLYEREPWFMLVLAGVGGAVSMWALGFVEDATLDVFGGASAGPAVMAAIAATHEELARLALVALVALVVPAQLNDPIDGLIYGSIVGLGMAVEESRWVMALAGVDGWALPGTEPVRLSGHLVLGGITGFAVGMARHSMPRWRTVLAACLTASVTIHFLWDWIAFTVIERRVMAGGQTVAAVVLMLAGMALYGFLVVTGSRWSQQVFAPASPRMVWGWPFKRRGRFTVN